MDVLTLFGLVAVTAMLIFYALEDRSPWFILAFAAACVMASAYGFLQGAWPFGIIEALWAGVATRREPGCLPRQRLSATFVCDADFLRPSRGTHARPSYFSFGSTDCRPPSSMLAETEQPSRECRDNRDSRQPALPGVAGKLNCGTRCERPLST
jgi:hypothetical protein